jgi:DNA-binding Lrp family transcriptional regulator
MALGRTLFAVFITNLLWGLIPIPAVAAMRNYSLFTMLLFRFLYTGLACVILVAIIRLRNPEARGIHAYLTSSNRAYTKRNVPQILSLAIVAFMLSVSLSLFFLSYDLVGVVIATMVSESITPVLLAFWNWAKGTEAIDILKSIYMMLLVLAVAVISVARVEADVTIKPVGFVVVALCAVFWTVYIALIAKDAPSKKEAEAVNFSAESYKVTRSTLKLGVTFLFSGLMIFPLTLILPPLIQVPELASQCTKFYVDLTTNFLAASTDSGILILSFGLTFAPYFLLYAAQAFWPKEALTFDQWSSILGLITPIVAAYVGILILGEMVRMDYTLIATAFLVTSIAMRYLHEVSNKVVGFVFLKIDVANKFNVYSQLKGIRELQEIYAITGKESDIYAEAVTSNLNHLYLLVSQKIRTIDGVKDVDIELVQKITTPHRK